MSLSGKMLVKSEVGPVFLDALFHGHSGVSVTTRLWAYEPTPPIGSWWLTPCPAIVKERWVAECIAVSFDDFDVTCGPSLEFLRPDLTWTQSIHLRVGDVVIGASGTVRVQAHRILDAPMWSYQIQGACALFDDGLVVRQMK
jgi:hypothetical protein